MSELPQEAKGADGQYRDQINQVDGFFLSKMPKWFYAVGAVCISLWVLNFFVAISGWDDRGLFGDVFGASNSIFSALALLGVAWSIAMQRDELRLIRDERDQTREILAFQTDHVGAQNKVMAKQAFEGTFFHLYSYFSTTISGFSAEKEFFRAGKHEVVILKGKNVFEVWGEPLRKLKQDRFEYYKRIRLALISGEPLDSSGADDADIPENISMLRNFSDDDLRTHAYEEAWLEYRTRVDGDALQYIRILLNMIDFVEVAELPDEDKLFYFKFINRQLSHHEKMFLNGVQDGLRRFDPLKNILQGFDPDGRAGIY